MTLELSREEESSLQVLVNAGRFTTTEEAVHAAVQALTEQHESWLAYARESIDEGLDDAENGRLIDAETYLLQFEARRRTAA